MLTHGASNALVTCVRLRVSMGNGDRLLSDDLHPRLTLKNVIKYNLIYSIALSTGETGTGGIPIALLVIVAVLALIVTSVVLLTPPDEGPRVKGRKLRIKDLMNEELVPLRWNGTWISGYGRIINLACTSPKGLVDAVIAPGTRNTYVYGYDNLDDTSSTGWYSNLLRALLRYRTFTVMSQTIPVIAC
ncbi:Dipeptidyl aminopeptidase-like protein 6 [Eumeta japonica]|uniref:Dipeptidyl aminopeptidase-like protein 6 n=1 Tax=Eumeta variegata TaxID=151549 RepID=A0A4C1YRS0_EUMVA|nr:Dipeptidyl aminopeptidase-like protein 6 [Eumeta japonica]